MARQPTPRGRRLLAGGLSAVIGLLLSLTAAAAPAQAGPLFAAPLCGEGSAPDYGFTYERQQPHWTVDWRAHVAEQTVAEVDRVLDELNEDSIAQTMILFQTPAQVGNRVNCAVHFLRYMQLGQPQGERQDNGFVFLIVVAWSAGAHGLRADQPESSRGRHLPDHPESGSGAANAGARVRHRGAQPVCAAGLPGANLRDPDPADRAVGPVVHLRSVMYGDAPRIVSVVGDDAKNSGRLAALPIFGLGFARRGVSARRERRRPPAAHAGGRRRRTLGTRQLISNRESQLCDVLFNRACRV